MKAVCHGVLCFIFPISPFHFFGPFGIELFFIGGKLAEQSQKLSSVYTFFVRYVLEHFHCELVCRLTRQAAWYN